MSWWVYLQNADGESVVVERHVEGGTYAMGGTERAELNVTYNYGARFREAIPEVEGSGVLNRLLGDRTGAESIPVLQRIVDHCGTAPSDDYWEPTLGNAGRAALTLLVWAREHPEARWEIN